MCPHGDLVLGASREGFHYLHYLVNLAKLCLICARWKEVQL